MNNIGRTIGLIVAFMSVAQPRTDIIAQANQSSVQSGVGVTAAVAVAVAEPTVQESFAAVTAVGGLKSVQSKLINKLKTLFKELLSLEVSKTYLKQQEAYDTALTEQKKNRDAYTSKRAAYLSKPSANKNISLLEKAFDRDPSTKDTLLKALTAAGLRNEWVKAYNSDQLAEAVAVKKSAAWSGLGAKQDDMKTYQSRVAAINKAAADREVQLRSSSMR